ncbi:hypothetical protein D3C83_269680 [compost metagenome]
MPFTPEVEEMFTTLRTMRLPSERSFSTAWRKCCWKARRTRNGAVRWTSRIAYHCSSLIFWITESQV